MAELINNLPNMYEKTSVVNKVYQMHRLFELEMIDGQYDVEFIHKFSVISQLA